MTMAAFQAATAGIAHAESGMFFSELYLFAETCQANGVTHILESGVCNGVSTRLLNALWPGRVVSWENNPRKVPAKFSCPVVLGNGIDLIPAWLKHHQGRRVGVLLDGPKGPKGAELRKVCFTFSSVRVVGQHDALRGQGETLHSQDPIFDELDVLDVRVPADVRKRYALGSPGLAIWVAP